MSKVHDHILKEAELFAELFKISHPNNETPTPQLLSHWFWTLYQDVNKLAGEY